MTSVIQLRKRWKEEPGITILEEIRDFFDKDGDAQKPLAEILNGLPYREEVPGGKDLRAVSFLSTRELDLQGYDFSYAQIHALYLCRLSHTRFDFCRGISSLSSVLNHSSFVKAKLRTCYFTNSAIQEACFKEADLRQAKFTNTNLRGSSFENATCNETSFYGANLIGCNFKGADLTGAFFSGAIMDKSTDFRGANLMNACFEEHRDYAGNLLAKGVDPRSALYDQHTVFGTNPGWFDLEQIQDMRYYLLHIADEPSISQELERKLWDVEQELRVHYKSELLSHEFYDSLSPKEQSLFDEAFEEGWRYRMDRMEWIK